MIFPSVLKGSIRTEWSDKPQQFCFQAISRHNPDKMKANAADAMPIAFLAMHEEKTEASVEVIAVWEEVSIAWTRFNGQLDNFSSFPRITYLKLDTFLLKFSWFSNHLEISVEDKHSFSEACSLKLEKFLGRSFSVGLFECSAVAEKLLKYFSVFILGTAHAFTQAQVSASSRKDSVSAIFDLKKQPTSESILD